MNTHADVLDLIPPYTMVQDFLGNDLIERLLAYASAKEAEFSSTKIGNNKGRLDSATRVSQLLRDLDVFRPELEERFQAIRPQAIIGLKLHPFDLARCEIELVAHGNGAFYKRHVDTATDNPSEGSQRALTGVLYFHSLPKRFSGGQLRLHAFSSPKITERYIDIEPERDKLVLFPSWASHEVLPISCPSGEFAHSRFAINCWYRRPIPN